MILLLAIASALAQDVSGFAELRGSYAVGADGTPWQLVERVRPSFDAPLSERVHLGVTVEAALAQGRDDGEILRDVLDRSGFGAHLEAAGCVWHDHDNDVLRVDDAGDYLFVDRLFVDWYHPDFDLRVGRQALQWGSALFINPTDPFPQVLFTEPWRPRAGVNSARISIPWGELNRLQAVVGTTDDFTAVRAAARGTVNWKQTDWSLIGAWRQESDELLAGVDVKGTALVGFWLEGALRFVDVSDTPEVVEQVAVGVDYSFPVLDMLVVAGQYVRNGASSDSGAAAALGRTADLTCAEGSPMGVAEPDPFGSFLTGTDYGLLSTSLAAGDVSASAAWLQNLGDGSGIVIPTVTVLTPAQIDVSLSAQIPVAVWGHGEFKPHADDLLVVLPGAERPADFSGLVPDANLFLWTRFNF